MARFTSKCASGGLVSVPNRKLAASFRMFQQRSARLKRPKRRNPYFMGNNWSPVKNTDQAAIADRGRGFWLSIIASSRRKNSLSQAISRLKL